MKNYDGATIKRLMKYIAGHAKGIFILSIICVLISTAANVSGSMFIQVLVDEYIEPLLLEDNPETGITRARTEGAPDERRLVMVRDSFTEAMEPVLQKYFAESVLIDWESIESTDIGSYGGDVLVYQVVERNLGRIPADLVSILENGS